METFNVTLKQFISLFQYDFKTVAITWRSGYCYVNKGDAI